MNVIQNRRMEREQCINRIVDSIQRAEKPISYKDILMAACANLNISMRTAKEYIEVALYKCKMTREELV